MSEVWGPDSGILRKHKSQVVEDLLVFGYSCKLFRDDEKALSIDQGKHLIPWMGDEKVKIDRYDGRGALSDLQAHEAITQWDNNEGLTDEEKRAEQLCDEERYRSLYERNDEEELRKEEALKRLHQEKFNTYGQVPFNYSDAAARSEEPAEDQSKLVDLEENEVYVPPPNLDVPINMKLPPNKKLAAIIERTASFIAQQGGQMEILLKAKQQHNPQFEFLNHTNELFGFYRHLLMALKTGRYKYMESKEDKNESDNETTTSHVEDEASYYLHPSLGSNISKVDSAPALPSIPTLNYKPSADCAYSMLVNKIMGTTTASLVEENTNINCPSTSPVEQNSNPNSKSETILEVKETAVDNSHEEYVNQWNEYYNSEEYKEYYRQYYMMTYGVDPMGLEAFDYNNPFMKTPFMYLQEQPPLPPPLPDESNVQTSESSEAIKPEEEIKPVKQKKPKLQIGALAQYYNSDSEDSDSDIELGNLVPIPLDAEKLVILKMATYVAKNGKEFEDIVKGKNDPRFDFLTPTHKYHSFYKTKLNAQLISMGKVVSSNGCEKDSAMTNEQLEDPKMKTITPVSFSIKKTKDAEQIIIKPASSLVDSDEEHEHEKCILDSSCRNDVKDMKSSTEASDLVKKTSDKQDINKENYEILNTNNKKYDNSDETPKADVETVVDDDEMVISSDPELSSASCSPTTKTDVQNDLKIEKEIENPENRDAKALTTDINNVINEFIDLTDESVKSHFDGEVIVLRENGSANEPSSAHIKQLQLVRKKRAMEFLSQLRSENARNNERRGSSRHRSSPSRESSRRRKSSKRSRRRSTSSSEESPPKSKKSKRKSKSHSHTSRTHKHRKHSKSNYEYD